QEFYLVQDYIAGHSLTEELQDNPPWNEKAVMEFLVEMLPILEFVHSQGAIHRDIKPDNLLRRHRDGHLMLIDFGAVKQIQLPTTFAGQVPTTQTIAIGTPGYMSSEQARGKPHFSSDIYALGVIALQALTGVKPHSFQYDPHTGEIDWPQDRCSPALAAVLNRMVAYHFRDRYQSAKEVYNVLTQVQPTPPKTHLPPVQSSSPSPSNPPTSPSPAPANPTSATYPVASPQPAASPPPPPKRPASTSPAPAVAASSNSPNFTLLLLGSILVIIFSVVFGAAVALNNLTRLQIGNSNRSNNSSSAALEEGENNGKNTCIVMVENGLNVRATPEGEKVGGVPVETRLTVTGQTEGKWLEIRSPVRGWVYGDRRYVQCTSSTFVETDTPSPSPPTTNPSPDPDQGQDLLTAAREKLETGNIQDAIAQINNIPTDSQVYRDAQNLLTQWSRIQERYNAMQEAIQEERWDDILADINTNGYPDSFYWKQKFQELVERARRQKIQEENQNNPPFDESDDSTNEATLPPNSEDSFQSFQDLEKPPKEPDFSAPVVDLDN
ncbi:MAG: protein kinase, partial [Kamptonema sp. SIO4C4]|nr:protein kinase [Kamptonema sp. SIO4C4]